AIRAWHIGFRFPRPGGGDSFVVSPVGTGVKLSDGEPRSVPLQRVEDIVPSPERHRILKRQKHMLVVLLAESLHRVVQAHHVPRQLLISEPPRWANDLWGTLLLRKVFIL